MANNRLVLDPTTIKKLQGVIQTLVQQYSADAGSAQAEFRAQTQVVAGLETRSQSREFVNTIDEPEVLGGTNKGPNPVEVLLGSLGTCQEIVLVAYAAALGIELESVKIDVRGDIDLRGLFNVAEVPSGFNGIRFEAEIKARNATPQQLEQLKALGLAHCPVLDTLRRPIPVETVYRLSTSEQAA
ncbi:MAG: OsmC family protein [Candidatus Lambdaproteobacteria bacterium]|nr:OsmC family protein [Candidatus Lambdaproteobacteria bacterium]